MNAQMNTPSAKLNPFSMAALAIQKRPPAPVARMVSLAVCAMALLAVLYTWLAHIDVVVSAQGRVIPSGKSKVIQPLEAGVVKSISVRDGQAVKAGDVLLELDPTNTVADSERLRRDLWEGEADALRLRATMAGGGHFAQPAGMPKEIAANQQALLANRLSEQHAKLATLEADMQRRSADRDAIAASLEQVRAGLPLVKKKNEMREELAKTGHIAETGVIETRLELINMEKELAVQGNRLKEAEAGLRAAAEQRVQAVAEFRARASTELVDATKKRDAARQELVKANQRRDLQILRSPIDGVVQQLAVSTVGGVVTPAQSLMTIVPAHSPLEVEAQVLNRDIGHVKVGQRVINKIETFDFTRFGYIEGTVQWVGTDAMLDPKLGPVYPVRIKLAADETPTSVRGVKGIITAGMSVTADVRTDQRRMVEYFLAPMLRYKEEALRER
ncbi:MAG TPA: HlyD family type I secretion periplasmic adaptor subunit [Burkholderiaceae bacterium]|nr:HlyD family type I secretion periplasmic adaptor subunit [Burkholderiaceae bacterium]